MISDIHFELDFSFCDFMVYLYTRCLCSNYIQLLFLVPALQVKLEQGIEILNIFKNYETDTSILDDFDFYEDRQKAMQERKARQQASLMVVGGNEHRNAVTLSTDFIKQMSKSYAQVVRLDDCGKDGTMPDRAGPASDPSMGARVKLDDAMTTAAVSSAQSS